MRIALALLAAVVGIAGWNLAARQPPAAAPVTVNLVCVPLTADREPGAALASFPPTHSPAMVCSGKIQ